MPKSLFADDGVAYKKEKDVINEQIAFFTDLNLVFVR